MPDNNSEKSKPGPDDAKPGAEESKPEPDNLPPFYAALKKYAAKNASLWCTPGHNGGEGLDYSELGRDFKKFFGKNIFASDLSSSVPELGSILEHEGPAGEAERQAAEIFGADTTLFVLNGTSTANKIVFFNTVAPGDIVLVGRNCHKSIMHAIIMNEAIPVYLRPKNNKYGLIGPIPISELSPEVIKKKLRDNPLVKYKKHHKVQLTVITNSTYDGLLYDAAKISSILEEQTHFLHFDEAWFPYGAFHPIYERRYAMSPYVKRRGLHMPPVFATQSTHKILYAFSQGSMLHFRQGTGKNRLDPRGLIEANMMHASTSPFYPMFASLDISARIMKDNGYQLLDSALNESISFRNYMANMRRQLAKKGDWWFKVFQPDAKKLRKNPEDWALRPDQSWHGFEVEENDDIMLDPLKVTILTPGIDAQGKLESFGIPASVVAKFLRNCNIVPEKSGFYNLLFLFTPGIPHVKIERLYKALMEFKRLYDKNTPIFEVFPDLRQYGECYPEQAGLRDLCDQMHLFQYRHDIVSCAAELYTELPRQAMAPHKAYYGLVEGRTEYLPLEEVSGRVSTFMILPYPPGIPLIMPGERFGAQDSAILRFLKMNELFDHIFRGFETEMHGIKKEWCDGKPVYLISCLKKNKKTNKETFTEDE